jgi:hypothetical protein
MKLISILLVLAATVGCAGAMRGPDTCADIHFDTTYVLARWAGWTEPEALSISAANFWTDKHGETNSVATEWRLLGGVVNPVTIPWVLCFGLGDMIVVGEAPGRAIGRPIAESTAWAVPSLGHRLHFPARDPGEPVTPAFFVNAGSGEIEYGNAEARRALEGAFLELQAHDEDREAILAYLGIGLHTLQDSFKHCGYTAQQGHIGARPDPDQACCNIDRTIACAEVTLNSLRYARRLATGRSSAPPPGWKEALRRHLSSVASPDPTVDRGWISFVRAQFRDDYADREVLLERWRRARGEEAFDRALERVRDALR